MMHGVYVPSKVIHLIVASQVSTHTAILLDLFTSALSYWARNRFSIRGFRYNFFSKNTVLVAASGFASGLIMASKYKRWICAIGGGLVSGLTNIISSMINRRRFSLTDLLIDVGFGLVWGYLGGNGVGSIYWIL